MIDSQGVLSAAITSDDQPLDPDVPNSITGFPGVVDRQNEVGDHTGCARPTRGLFTTLETALAMADLRRDPVIRAIDLPSGAPPQPEQDLLLGGLEKTLRALAVDGSHTFCRSRLADRMVTGLQTGGSRIDGDDLTDHGPRA